jgi:cardiolipin synthase
MKGWAYYLVNGITLSRVLAAPVLFILIFNQRFDLFKWGLLLSFATDAIDGFLARRYHVVSVFGAKMDSIGDDLTVAAGIVGLLSSNMLFLMNRVEFVIALALLYIVQLGLAFYKYQRMTNFHTYVAKVAAVSQAAFLLSFFFFTGPLVPLFYLTVALTALDLIEEIVLIFVLPIYAVNVKGLFWVLRHKSFYR